MSRVAADFLLVACAAIWGLGFLFQKSAMGHVEPLTFVAARCFVAAIALAPLVLVEGRISGQAASPADMGRLRRLSLLAGSAFAAGAGLQQAGLMTATVTNAGFLTALYVVLTPFVSRIVTGRSLAPVVWLAAALSFVGMWLLSGGTISAEAFAGFHRGDMLIALSALFWAMHVVVVGLGAPLGRPLLFTAAQFVVAGVIASAGAVACETISVAALRAALPDILYVGVLSGALTFSVFTLALRKTSPTEAVIILSSEMLFAATGAWWWRGEEMTASGVVGAVAILAAILLVQLARSRPRRNAGGPTDV